VAQNRVRILKSDSSVGIAIRLRDGRSGVLGFDSRRGLGIFLFTTVSRTVLGPTQPPTQRVPGTLSLGVKRLRREAGHSPPPIAEVKNTWSYTSTPQYVFMAWCLVKHRGNFTFEYKLLCKAAEKRGSIPTAATVIENKRKKCTSL
jgi:hypothetical protein